MLAVLNLHARCRVNKCLPLAGGVLDQPAYLMELFDVIDQTHDAFKQKEHERVEAEALQEKLATRLARA